MSGFISGMAEESFMLVSLKENQAKKLAQVISNETSRKILDFLSQQESTESEISRALKMPISTVHYNLQHLVENKLVIAEEFHYSQKGKEMLHYKLANKLIIIAPATTDEGFMKKLKRLFPLGIITLAATAVIAIINQSSNIFFSALSRSSAGMDPIAAKEAAPMLMAESTADVSATATAAQGAAATQADFAASTAQSVSSPSFFSWNSIAVWFLVGAVFAIFMYFLLEKVRERKQAN
ncbi:MAG: ArsR family transcriptional regulator [archaeon GW2011_AR3]|nr:MAG: ArsR family transcriptional regulator [archaeon GW2011_AR3]